MMRRQRKIFARRGPLARPAARWSLGALAVALCVLGVAALASTERNSQRSAALAEFQRPEGIPFPPDNPYSEAKAELGRMLFFDPILSGSGTRACATCHSPGLSWGDGLPRAVGEAQKPLALRSPTLVNIAWIPVLGWDGKFRNLEAVTFAPMKNPNNMNRKEEDLLAALTAIPGYRAAFAMAFPDGAINHRNIELAIATFERTIVSGTTPFDRWVAGDERAIGEPAKRGFDLFVGKAGCAECHSGWNFTDAGFYDIGSAAESDIGRGNLVPTSPKLQHAFKTPSLRDVARRAPYLHDGSEPTLEAVIDLYDRGGVERPSRSELIKPLGLDAEERADLVAFLRTLTEEPGKFRFPILPR